MSRINFPTTFFQDVRFRKFSVETRLVAVYLMTCSRINTLGLYHLPLTQISQHLHLDHYYVEVALHNLQELHFCRYDEIHEYVWICEFAAWQEQEEPFPFKRQLKRIEPLSFLKEFYTFYADYYRGQKVVKFPPKKTEAQQILDNFFDELHKERGGNCDGAY